MIESGILPLEKVVTSVIAMDDIVSGGFEQLFDPQGNQLKILVKVADA
ncbi:hypothetical protein [Pseudomonas huanghezhanensis]|nr:hypothetical protein [Pseudomonas sp. BSw22131]